MFPPFLLCWELFKIISGCWVCQKLVCIYWYDHMIFILHFAYMVYHVNWLPDIVSTLYSRSKSHLIMVCDFLMCSGFGLLIFYWGFLHLCSSGILAFKFSLYFGFLKFEYNMLTCGLFGIYSVGVLWTWVCVLVPVTSRRKEIQKPQFLTLPLSNRRLTPMPNSLSRICFLRLRKFPWLVWLSRLSASLWTKGSLVRFSVRENAWVAGQVPK